MINYTLKHSGLDYKKINSVSVLDINIPIMRESHINIDNVFKMLEFVLCVPGTTASVERIFKLMNMYWSEEKSRLNVGTLKAVLIVKTHFSRTCSKFYDYLSKNHKLQKQFHGSEKYT